MLPDERGDEEDAGLPELAQLAAAAHEHPPPAAAAAAGSPNPAESTKPSADKADADRSNGSLESKPSNGLESKPSVAGSEASSEGSSGASAASPHYDAARDVVLRLEFLRESEFKVVIRAVWGAVLAGVALLIVVLWAKIDQPDSHYIQTDTVPVVNLAFGGVLLPLILVAWGIFFFRVYRSNLSGKRWSHRRRRASTLAGVELSVQLVNVTFFVLPNAWVLGRLCSWFEPLVLWAGFVRWTCWNLIFLIFLVQAHSANPATSRRWRKHVDRADGAVMDAPLWAHWPKLFLWFTQEGLLLALTITVQTTPSTTVFDPTITDCRQQPWDCHFSPASIALVSCETACLVTYFLLWLFFVARALNNLKHLPYNSMRMANLTTRLQIKLRALSISFFVLCSVCYTFVKLDTCSSYVLSWLGYLPMQVVATVTAVANGYMAMPKRPHQAGVLQVWLQEFAWLERDVPRKVRERASGLPEDSYENFCLDCEPLWCFETTVKMMYWSFLVYDYQEERPGVASPYSTDTALLLYELEHWECVWERSLDTKAVVGWSSDTVVIAFRGTASLANVKSDLQVWRTRWPTGVGNPLMGTAPMVHRGFHTCYTANGFNDKLLSRLEHILYRCADEQRAAGGDKPVTVYVTGHSLGGALAMLCAYDIKKRCPCAEYLINVKCYTFGAPRPGNRAFARLYNEAVPDTWHIINNDDVITKAGKFWFLYKRTGHRVLINKLGDLVVRPSFVERAIRGVPGGASVRDHLLTQYQKAIMSVVAGQFGTKSFGEGKDGVLSLAEQKGLGDVLHTGGLTVRELRVLRERGWDAYQRLVHRQARKQGRKTSSWLRPGSKQPVQLEAVVVAGEEEEEGAAGEAPEAAPAPAQPAAVQPAAPALAPEPATAEERDGVLQIKQMHCRTRSGKRCQTICSLMPRRTGGAALPAAPEADAPAPAQLPSPGLQAVAEGGEEGEAGADESPPASPSTPGTPSTPGSPSTPRHERRRHRGAWWRRPWSHVAAVLDWSTDMGRLGSTYSLSRSVSLASTMSSEESLSFTTPGADTRGSLADAPALPLVLRSVEATSGDALAEHATRMAVAQMAAQHRARSLPRGAEQPQPQPRASTVRFASGS